MVEAAPQELLLAQKQSTRLRIRSGNSTLIRHQPTRYRSTGLVDREPCWARNTEHRPGPDDTDRISLAIVMQEDFSFPPSRGPASERSFQAIEIFLCETILVSCYKILNSPFPCRLS